MLIQGNGKPFSIIYKLKQADVPVQYGFADEHCDNGGQGEGGAEGEGGLGADLHEQGSHDDAHHAGDHHHQQALAQGQEQADDEQQLDIAAAHGLLAQDLVHDQAEEQHGERDDQAGQSAGEQCLEAAGEQQLSKAGDDGNDNEPVGDDLRVQIHKAQAEQAAGEDQGRDQLGCDAVLEEQAHEHHRKCSFGEGIAGGDGGPAVAALAPEEEPTKQGHQVTGGEHMTAGGAGGALGAGPLFAGGKPQGQTVQGRAHHQTQQRHQQAQIDHNMCRKIF